MTVKNDSIALRADPNDPEDFDVSEGAVQTALADRAARRRGAQIAPTKEAVSIRLDGDLLSALRASGPGWQGRANDILRKAVL